MRKARAFRLAAAACALTGCAAKPVAPEDAALPAEELAVVDDAAASTVALGQGLAVGDALLDFGAGIDSQASVTSIGAIVGKRAFAAVAACSGATASQQHVRVAPSGGLMFFDFGKGCTLPSGVAVAGAADLSIAKVGPSTVDLPMDLTGLEVAGRELNGAIWYCTEGGTTFNVPAVLSLGDASDSYQVTVKAAAEHFTIDGTLSSLRGAATVAASYQGVVWRPADCYPSGGTMTVTTRTAPLTVHFSASSGARGVVEVARGTHVEAHTLPAYGTCPHSP